MTDTSVEEYEPAWSPDGKRVAFVVANTRIDVVDLGTGARTTAVTVPADQVIHSPAWTPDGKDLIYSLVLSGRSELWRSGKALVTGEEVFPFRVSWRSKDEFVYTADGEDPAPVAGRRRPARHRLQRGASPSWPREYRKRRRDFDSAKPRKVVGIGSPVLSPDGEQVAFRALNDIYTMRIGQAPQPLTRDHWWKSRPGLVTGWPVPVLLLGPRRASSTSGSATCTPARTGG